MYEQDIIDLFSWLGVDKWLHNKEALNKLAHEIFNANTGEMQCLHEELDKLNDFINQLKKEQNLSKGDIQSWWRLYSSDLGFKLRSDLNTLGADKTSKDYLGFSDNVADKTMAYTYLALTLTGIVIAGLAYAPGGNAIVSAATGLTASTAIGASWNYIDVIGGFVQAAKAFHDNNYAVGSATLFSSAQLLSMTLTANIGYYVTHTITAATAGALMGFAFAACMIIAAGIEYAKAYSYEKKMAKMKPDLDAARELVQSLKIKLSASEKPNNDLQSEYNEALSDYSKQQSAYFLLEAKCADHKRAAVSWSYCAIAMTAVAVVALFATGAATFGAVPAAVLAIAVVAAISGAVRIWWKNSVKHEDNLNKSFAKGGHNTKSLKQRVDDLVIDNLVTIDGKEIGLDSKVEISGIGHFSKTSMTLGEYLYKMLHQSPEKAESIVKLLENGNTTSAELKPVLDKRRGASLGLGDATGIKLLNGLLSKKSTASSEGIKPQGAPKSAL